MWKNTIAPARCEGSDVDQPFSFGWWVGKESRLENWRKFLHAAAANSGAE